MEKGNTTSSKIFFSLCSNAKKFSEFAIFICFNSIIRTTDMLSIDENLWYGSPPYNLT